MSNTSCIYPVEKGIIGVSLYVIEGMIMGAGIAGDFMQINDIDFDPLEGQLVGVKAEESGDRTDRSRIF